MGGPAVPHINNVHHQVDSIVGNCSPHLLSKWDLIFNAAFCTSGETHAVSYLKERQQALKFWECGSVYMDSTEDIKDIRKPGHHILSNSICCCALPAYKVRVKKRVKVGGATRVPSPYKHNVLHSSETQAKEEDGPPKAIRTGRTPDAVAKRQMRKDSSFKWKQFNKIFSTSYQNIKLVISLSNFSLRSSHGVWPSAHINTLSGAPLAERRS